MPIIIYYRTNQYQITEKGFIFCIGNQNSNWATEWYNPVIQKHMNDELTDHELVYEIFEPFEQVSQLQAQLPGATFEMLSGGPAQTHVGTGGGGSSSDMPWGEKKKDNNTSRRRR